MPRFFHVHDGTTVLDNEGTLLPDLSTARQMAARYAGELLRDIGRDLHDGEDWKVDLANEHGLILFTILLTAFHAPAVQRDSVPMSLNPG